jgi:hypothetical protein
MLPSPFSKTIIVKFKAISVGAWFRALSEINMAAQLLKNIVLISSRRLIELGHE